MFFVKVMVITLVLKLGRSYAPSIDDSLSVSKAIADICEVFFIKKSVKFNLIIYGERTRHLDDVTDGFLNLVGGNFSTRILYFEDVDHIEIFLADSAVLLFKNDTFLQVFNLNVKLKNSSPKLLKFVIYCEGLKTISQVPTVKYYNWDFPDISSFEYFVLNKNSSVILTAFDHFNWKSCNSINYKVINTFSKNTQKWTKKLRNFRNFRNFNGCMLTYMDSFNSNFLLNSFNEEILNCVKLNSNFYGCMKLIRQILKRPGVKFHGLMYEIFEAMAKRGNFVPNYNFFIDGYLISKGNFTVTQEIRIYETGYYSELLEKTHMTSSYFDHSIGLYVTPSEYYDSFEKLLLPFDVWTWILLLATFITINIVLFAMRFTSKEVKKFVFGCGIKTPGLNVLRIFFGIGQTKLPNESILRFILIFFVMFCLIMRTCYQSKMFDFITTDMRKPPPKTLEEVIDRGYQFYTQQFMPINMLNELGKSKKK